MNRFQPISGLITALMAVMMITHVMIQMHLTIETVAWHAVLVCALKLAVAVAVVGKRKDGTVPSVRGMAHLFLLV
jgi:hypothetical protein